MNANKLAEKILTLVNLPGTREIWADRRNGLPVSSYDAVISELSAALENEGNLGYETGFKAGRDFEHKNDLIDARVKAAYLDAAKIVDGQARLLRDYAKATSLVLDRDEREAFAECVEKLASTIRAKAEEIK